MLRRRVVRMRLPIRCGRGGTRRGRAARPRGGRCRAGRAAAVRSLRVSVMLPRSSGSRPPPGRVATRRCNSRARVSGRSWLRSGSGVVISRSRSWQRPARFALTAPSRAATRACSAWRSQPARGVAGRSLESTLRAARTASSASVLPPVRRSRRNRPTSSTRSPRLVRKRVRPAPNDPVPSIANARRPSAFSSTSFNACV